VTWLTDLSFSVPWQIATNGHHKDTQGGRDGYSQERSLNANKGNKTALHKCNKETMDVKHVWKVFNGAFVHKNFPSSFAICQQKQINT